MGLVLVAATQIALVRWSMLSPWKGGGFGMFSTLEARPFRYLRIFVEARERSEELEVAPWLEALAASAEILPSDASLERVAREVVAHERSRARGADSVRLELWRVDFEPSTLKPHSRKLKDYAWHAPP